MVHLCKERFPIQRKSKLNCRGDGTFQVIEIYRDNAYKIDLPSKYNISTTFNISDLFPFYVGDGANLKTNPFQVGGYAEIPLHQRGSCRRRGRHSTKFSRFNDKGKI
jgi:hypothetical protein